jgi:hypothetical protein
VDTAQTGLFGISHARVTAYAAVLLLCGVVGWQAIAQPSAVVQNETTPSTENVQIAEDYLASLASTTQTAGYGNITPLGASIFAQALIAYDKALETSSSTDVGLAAVQAYGTSVRPSVDYKSYAAGDILTTADTSKDRVLAYRADLRTALEPLLENKEYELDIYAQYVDTKDAKYLAGLHSAAQNYRIAVSKTEKVVAPVDASVYHASILSSLSKFASTLEALADNANDPFASAALLRTFLDAQDGVIASFNSIGKYATSKIL